MTLLEEQLIAVQRKRLVNPCMPDHEELSDLRAIVAQFIYGSADRMESFYDRWSGGHDKEVCDALMALSDEKPAALAIVVDNKSDPIRGVRLVS